MADSRIRMPSGIGGLVSYSDEVKSKIMLKPEHVAGIICLVIILEIVLQVI